MPLGAAAITALITAGKAGADMIAQGLQNRKNRKLAEYSYGKDIAQYNRANEYNTPQAQMERLKAAGLNPNLVYGTGTVAGNTAQSTSPKYQAPTLNIKAPNTQPLETLGAYQNLEIQKAQTDNIRANTEYTRNKTANEDIKALLFGIDYESKQIDLELQKGSAPYQAQANQAIAEEKKLDLQKKGLENKTKAQDVNIKSQLLTNLSESERKIEAEVENLNKQGKNLDQDLKNKIAETFQRAYENEIRDRGLNPNDPTWMRKLLEVWDNQNLSYSAMKERLQKWLIGNTPSNNRD